MQNIIFQHFLHMLIIHYGKSNKIELGHLLFGIGNIDYIFPLLNLQGVPIVKGQTLANGYIFQN